MLFMWELVQNACSLISTGLTLYSEGKTKIELDNFYTRWLLDFTMRTYGVNQEFQFDEGIWLHRMSGQIRFFFRK